MSLQVFVSQVKANILVSKERYNSVFHINNCINIYNYEKAYTIIKDNYRIVRSIKDLYSLL